MDLYKVEIGNIFDFDNNGFLDIALYSSQNASILYFYNDLETKMMNFGDNRYNYDGIGRYKAALEIDLNGDGIPDFMETILTSETTQASPIPIRKNLQTSVVIKPKNSSRCNGMRQKMLKHLIPRCVITSV